MSSPHSFAILHASSASASPVNKRTAPTTTTTTSTLSSSSPAGKDASPTRLAKLTEPRSSTTSTTPTLASGSSYFTFPVTYSVNGLLRRLSADTQGAGSPPSAAAAAADGAARRKSEMKNPLSKSLSSSLSWSRSSSRTRTPSESGEQQQQQRSSVFTRNPSLANPAYMPAPLARTVSPFQPPPLTPLTLFGYKASTAESARLMTKAIAEEIRLLVPPRLQLAEEWRLVFGLEQDGVSLATLYQKCEDYVGSREGFVLVVKDAAGGTFGAFLTEAPHPHPHYFGTGECFLWRATVLPSIPDLLSSLPPPPSADTTHATRMTTLMNTNSDGSSTGDSIRFKAFPYSGVNDYMIFCESTYLSVGGGDGHYGLWLDDNLENGVSSMCLTFGNEPLSDEGTRFDVIGVEIWHLGR